jgi:hypothetical protein
VLHGAIVLLVRVDALIVSVVAGDCPGVSRASLSVKHLLPGRDPVAMSMPMFLPIEEGESIHLAGSVGQHNDASAADSVAGWVAIGAVADRVVRSVAFVVPR